jgi:hypothetical protein
MGLITVSGDPGCRQEEVARLAAQRLSCELVTESRLRQMVAEDFGSETAIPEKAWAHVVCSILAPMAIEQHLMLCLPSAEMLFRGFLGVLRVLITAPESRRIGNLMLDHRLDRSAAKRLLQQLDLTDRGMRRVRFGRATALVSQFDLVCNADTLEAEQMAQLIETAARVRGILDQGFLSPGAEAQLQFQFRLSLAKHGIHPSGKVNLRKTVGFMHPSEQIFANLLDFYRIAWEYEPRSFPVQWDKNGNVLEAFTPDFYLPEFDLYVEITTMKQSLVTKKNRKVKLLRAIYPHLNIQVFYQKDFQDLVFKYGLAEAREPQPVVN